MKREKAKTVLERAADLFQKKKKPAEFGKRLLLRGRS